MNIMIVEDDYASSLLLKKYLEKFGDVSTAENGKLALEMFVDAYKNEHPFDLVCLDIMLPLMNGQEVLVAMRDEENRRHIQGLDKAKIVMVSALNEAKQIMLSFKEQCDGYLTKPVFYDKLMTELEKLDIRPLDT